MRISLEEAAIRLQNGEVVAIPTETVYGLAADATNDIALQKIFTTKQRPADHPLIVHIADISQVAEWVTDFPEVAVKLAKTFWPGALTLILPAKNHVSRVVRGGEPTIALRVPNHPVALELLKLSKLSVAAPSANLFTQLSPTTATHVEAGLGESIPVLDGGACQVGIESTIVSVAVDGQWQLLRPGMISEVEVAKVAGRPQKKVAESSKVAAAVGTPKAPGQHALHYSPRTPLLLFKDRAALLDTSEQLIKAGKACAALLIGDGDKPRCYVMQLTKQPAEVAEQLYGALHQLDALKVDRLLVELPPNTPDWAAVLDRLSRAGFNKDT
ncbi:L-threonylcarbamoyladenylate synthase [Methylotenera sp.]|uniref:L-threonylcarbamoyladenylate synthase n=1 Tax=Methylotenera sp. TaxID=2051956 RepID=UPI0024885854|nr:L-threonylcarbamoyladenylate synthase [Methylotenera sp.]MDI1360704.1 L-threonylcarbamoyladenylate synthase [Methylotenera sp.]